MAGNDSSISPYLLRPLRTLEQVLGGPSRPVEPRPERVEGRQTRDGRDEMGATAAGEHRSAP
jgi:hypothetical protein